MTERALSFDVVADQYDTARPSYPDALFDAVEEIAGFPLAGARAVDVGAGTGIATRRLRDRGCAVTAVEPGPGMAARLHRVLPDVPLVRGTGDALPLAAASADLVTYAQSWHWTDPARSLPEALRVLRPGGALALWWNVADPDVPWNAAQDERLRAATGGGAHGGGSARNAGDAVPPLPEGRRFVRRTVRWTRTIPLDTHLANLGSHSLFRMIAEERAAALLAAERAELTRLFPDGTVEEAYVVALAVTLADAHSSG